MSDLAHAAHLAVISDRKALGWVLDKRCVAFPEPRMKSLFPHFVKGDVLYLYTTRGCFKNPARDKGRVIAKVVATADMTKNDDPVTFGERNFPYELRIAVESLFPARQGIELDQQVPHMTSFPKAARWSVYLRRSVFELSSEDATMFDRLLDPYRGKLNDNLGAYQALARIGVVMADQAAQ